MEKSILSNSLIQIQSIGKFLQDIWLSAFIVSVLSIHTSLPIPFLWVGIQIMILISVAILFHKIGYQIAVSVAVSVFFGLAVFAFNGPFWLFALIVAFSIWRIQERFAKIQEDATHDGIFFSLLVVFFVISSFYASIFQTEAVQYTYILATSGISVFVLERLTVQWLLTKDINNLRLYKVGYVYLAIISLASTVFFLITQFAQWTRLQIVYLLGDVIIVILYPIGKLMEWLRGFLHSNVRTPEEKAAVTQPEQAAQETVERSELVNVTQDIPWTIIIIIISALLLLFFIWRVSRMKKEVIETADIGQSYNRELISQVPTAASTDLSRAYSMETNKVRDAYREFEKEANNASFTRKKEETIREWFNRENWHVIDRFYTVYDVVRYSQGMMDAEDGEWFIHELTLLSEKYLQYEV